MGEFKLGVGNVQGFEGTPIECEAWMRKQFDAMRAYVEGWTSEVRDGEYVPADNQQEKLDVYDRSVWKVTIEPTEHVAVERMRSSMVDECVRVEAERELFDTMARHFDDTLLSLGD